MKTQTVALWLAALGGAFISYIGLSYLIAPDTIVGGFGFGTHPAGDADGFFQVKGTRDAVSGLVIFVLIGTRQYRALATVLALFALIPIGDAINVVAHDGSIATALEIHTATALFVLLSAGLLFRSLSSRRSEGRGDAAGELDESGAVATR